LEKNLCSLIFIVIVTDIQNFCDRNSIMHNKNQMPPVTFFNKVRIVSLAQGGKSSTQIAAALGIPRTTINPIIKKWRQDGTVERHPGSGGHRVSTCEEDEQLTAVI
jgi:biotin operon repressor